MITAVPVDWWSPARKCPAATKALLQAGTRPIEGRPSVEPGRRPAQVRLDGRGREIAEEIGGHGQQPVDVGRHGRAVEASVLERGAGQDPAVLPGHEIVETTIDHAGEDLPWKPQERDLSADRPGLDRQDRAARPARPTRHRPRAHSSRRRPSRGRRATAPRAPVTRPPATAIVVTMAFVGERHAPGCARPLERLEMPRGADPHLVGQHEARPRSGRPRPPRRAPARAGPHRAP